MGSMVTPEQLAMITSGLNILQQTRLMRISAITIALYDHVITLSDEIQLIWAKRWSLGKILFLIIRYQNIAIVAFEIAALFNNHPSQKLCHAWLQWQFYAAMSVFLWTEVVMQIRVYAMYGASKKILFFMLPLFAANIFTTGTFIGKVLLNKGLAIQLTPTLSLCSISGSPSFTFWIPVICFETILFVLALYKGIEHFRIRARVDKILNRGKGGFVKSFIESMVSGSTGGASGRGNSAGWRGQRAIDILVRDSVLYYGVIFVVYFLQALFFIFDKPLVEAPAGWAYFIPTVLSSRLLFNIRRVFDATTFHSVGTGTAFSTTVSRYNFSDNHGSNVGSRTGGGGRGLSGRGLPRSNSRLGSKATGTTLVVHAEETETGTQRTLTVTDGSRDYYAYDMDGDRSTTGYGRSSEESRNIDYDHDFDDEHIDESGNTGQRWISLGWLAAEAAGNRHGAPTGPSLTLSSQRTNNPNHTSMTTHPHQHQLFEMNNLRNTHSDRSDDPSADVKRLGRLSEVDERGRRDPEDLEHDDYDGTRSVASGTSIVKRVHEDLGEV